MERQTIKRPTKGFADGMVSRIGLALAFFLLTSGQVLPEAQRIGYRVVAEYPHDSNAFTQGLLFHGGFLYESTGLQGQSSLREVELETGSVRRRRNLPDSYFAEGMALVGEHLIQITWTSGKAFVYRLDDFSSVGTHDYSGQGWGLAFDGKRLAMSDGSAVLRFRDPGTFDVTGAVEVHDDGQPVTRLNELEFVDGSIFANIWHSNRIARIDPESGAVTGWLDVGALAQRERAKAHVDVVNGIAWDGRRLLITGKYWSTVYALELFGE